MSNSGNQHILEKMQIVPCIVPVNLATGANTGDWVSLKNYKRCAVVFVKGAGTGGQDPTLTFLQATTVAGAGSKNLTSVTRGDRKAATALTSVGTFTTVTQAAANTFTATDGAAQALWVVDIKAEDLDIDGGFDCMQVNIADPGTGTALGSVLYLLHDPRDVAVPLASAIVD
jgi:hypothetical protein